MQWKTLYITVGMGVLLTQSAQGAATAISFDSVLLGSENVPTARSWAFSSGDNFQIADNGSVYFQTAEASAEPPERHDVIYRYTDATGVEVYLRDGDTLSGGGAIYSVAGQRFDLLSEDKVATFNTRVEQSNYALVRTTTARTAEILIEDGDLIPGTGGASFLFHPRVNLAANTNGAIAFTSLVSSSRSHVEGYFYMASSNGPVTVGAVSQDTLPCGELYDTPDPGPYVLLGGVNAGGNYSGQYLDATSTLNIFEYTSGVSGTCRIAAGEIVDGEAIEVKLPWADFNDSRDIVFVAETAFGHEWLVSSPGAGTPAVPIVKAGDEVPGGGGAQFIEFPSPPAINNFGDVVFMAYDTSAAGSGLYFYDGQSAEISVLLRARDPVPGHAPRTFSTLNRGVRLTDSRYIAFMADLDDLNVGLFRMQVSNGTCSDGLQNQGEVRIDCGGPCPACACTADSACANGIFCDGAETCDAYGHCQTGTPPCTGLSCRETDDTCVALGNGDCDADGDYDLVDFACLQRCFDTVAVGVCERVNLVGDALIDLDDAAAFVAAITGPR